MIATTELKPRPGVAETFRHAMIMTRRNLMRLRTNPFELVGMVMFPVIFVVLFVFVFGGAISGSQTSYLMFALPGILVQGAIFGSQSTGQGMHEDISKGVFDRFRSLPIARSAPLLGQITGDVVRIGLGILITFAFGVALGFRVHTGPVQAVLAFAVMLAFSFSFSWILTFIGVVAKSPVVVGTAAMIVMFPLTFASSVFVPAHTLPGPLQAWSTISPVSLLSDTVRGLLLGGPVLEPGWKALVWAVLIVAVFAPLSVRAYLRRA
jgi:oleandomycin transport system permease protein